MQKQSCRGLILMPILAGLWSSPTCSLPTTNAQQDAKDAEIERLRRENAVLQELVRKLQQKVLQTEQEQAKMKNVLAELGKPSPKRKRGMASRACASGSEYFRISAHFGAGTGSDRGLVKSTTLACPGVTEATCS
jgi:hypothetical protein